MLAILETRVMKKIGIPKKQKLQVAATGVNLSEVPHSLTVVQANPLLLVSGDQSINHSLS
ncbi:unnamed protein product [Cyprideis torosa]|uniref:Uncharacterized protein n=1 Tax=Cyprideis torosa TaxID=163714 RepID=A0A7R8W6B6_9CRUS|nr:unnamed protein product [Cyprideis torosa]CAG0883926.1 unnamed protein product [Cyprideis torosa]